MDEKAVSSCRSLADDRGSILLRLGRAFGRRPVRGAGGAREDDEGGSAEELKFSPAVIEIDSGATVTWTNNDNFPHNVHLLDGSDQTVDLGIGETGSITFEEPATIFYECSIHPQQMRGKIVVT